MVIIRLSIILLISQNAVVSAKMILNAKTLALEKRVKVLSINASKRKEAARKEGVISYLLRWTYLLVLVEVALKS